MKATLCGIALLAVVSVPNAHAFCEDNSNRSVVLKVTEEESLCSLLIKPFSYLGTKVVTLGGLLEPTDPLAALQDSYWDEWLLNQESEPVLTGNYKSSFVGIGLWAPAEIARQKDEMSMQEWLMSQGLHVGVGFGEKGKEPRLRLDYRWHEDYQGDMMMQVEVPF
ncbi:hypothetical protein BCU70_01475 [Vibrio sp. 10N.286.49.C2]|uniref:hypothetical protein n=1 Tax=unclassified Vibrio TaxID=2614977 RepID=UPI000C84FB10|nr:MULTISPECIES: hypothetical protein [unclassified Vibrio]PMH42855.1 hypothetical protein BCU70_01475 [Vibrio sp. 10N.286.49.C2]PMH53806.1 hypothetical protein BCU66_13360 [Vibrio sp. 10N.286.49.B1]PMH82910.1 hypothetical protein BCU58_16555 [Vibrio sp. 10N.286.48.B7]